MSALIFARLARSIELMVRGRTRTGRRSPLHEEVANLRAQLAAAEHWRDDFQEACRQRDTIEHDAYKLGEDIVALRAERDAFQQENHRLLVEAMGRAAAPDA